MLAFTALCLLCGFAANYPNETMLAMEPVPALMVLYPLLHATRHPIAMITFTVAGAVIGFWYCNKVGQLLFPIFYPLPTNLSLDDHWRLMRYSNIHYAITAAVTPALGALAFGSTLLAYERLGNRKSKIRNPKSE